METSHMSSKRFAHFAAVFFAAVALSVVLATSAFAEPNVAEPCADCHSGAGPAPTVTLASSTSTTVTYNVQQVGSAWAAFDGNSRLAFGDGSNGTFTGPVGHTFKVFAVGGYPGPIGTTTVTGGGATTFTITPSAGANGSISPNSPQTVAKGASVTFTITPASGYHIADVLVNGASVGGVGSYTFTNVTANGTISATFAANPSGTFTITPSAGANGSISPATAQTVASGASVTFTITPASGYHVADVLVNGASVGAVASYTFTNVTANGTIAATFAADQQASTVSIVLTGLKAGAIKLHKTVTVKGAVKPAHAGVVKITFQRKVGSKWVAAKAVAGTMNATSGAYSYTYKPTKAGSYRVQTTVAATPLYKAAATSWKTFKVK
jgi:hypothetical protein